MDEKLRWSEDGAVCYHDGLAWCPGYTSERRHPTLGREIYPVILGKESDIIKEHPVSRPR